MVIVFPESYNTMGSFLVSLGSTETETIVLIQCGNITFSYLSSDMNFHRVATQSVPLIKPFLEDLPLNKNVSCSRKFQGKS